MFAYLIALADQRDQERYIGGNLGRSEASQKMDGIESVLSKTSKALKMSSRL